MTKMEKFFLMLLIINAGFVANESGYAFYINFIASLACGIVFVFLGSKNE